MQSDFTVGPVCCAQNDLPARAGAQKEERSGFMAERTADNGRVLSVALDIGKSMICCGAEINRVEETVLRICDAYGHTRTEVFSVVSMILATTTRPDGMTDTQTRRIYAYSTDFEKLDKLNALSRRICRETPPPEEVVKALEAIESDKRHLLWYVGVGYFLAGFAFALFFGGTLKDAAASALIALPLWLLTSFVKVQGLSKLFFTALSSAALGFLAIIAVKLSLADNSSMVMIGDIMLLIPGLLLINSVREMLCGDLMSGLLRLLECIILALAIACGFAVPILIFR